MPKFLQGMLVPTLMLWLYAIAFGIIHGGLPEGAEMSPRAGTAADFALPLILAWWVIADARKRGKRLCYDYDAFISSSGLLSSRFIYFRRAVPAPSSPCSASRASAPWRGSSPV
jgi:hypothetical protein